jgi:hypothetical protein
MAESSGNLDVKEAAYNHYLDLNPKGERASEVRYQRARVDYDKNRHDKAAEEFRSIALVNSGDPDTRKKAADLALDALLLAKQEGRIESWALEFAQAFPKARVEYLNIARRAVLSEVAVISNDQKSSDSELKRAAQRLSKLNLDGTTQDERTLISKNHMVLTVRTRDLEETNRATDRLLAIKGLSAADRELALEKKVWVAEMRLEFDKAYRFTQEMRMPTTAEADRHLRLAYLAELAGRNPTRHYNDVLNTSRSKAKSELAAIRLVRLAQRPWNELSRLEGVLRGNRELFAGLVLENFRQMEKFDENISKNNQNLLQLIITNNDSLHVELESVKEMYIQERERNNQLQEEFSHIKSILAKSQEYSTKMNDQNIDNKSIDNSQRKRSNFSEENLPNIYSEPNEYNFIENLANSHHSKPAGKLNYDDVLKLNDEYK